MGLYHWEVLSDVIWTFLYGTGKAGEALSFGLAELQPNAPKKNFRVPGKVEDMDYEESREVYQGKYPDAPEYPQAQVTASKPVR